MKFGSCRIKPGASKKLNKRFTTGRGKNFEYKFISENKVLVYKKGIEFLITDKELIMYFDIGA